MKDMLRIYVTGSTGLAGHNIVDALRAHASYDVITSAHADVDLLDAGQTREFITSVHPDLIVHAAGKVGGIKANMADLYGFMRDNMLIGINVVDAAVSAGVPRMLNLSSACAYPCALSRPLRECDIMTGTLEPTNEGYAIAKLAIMRMCDFATRKYGVSYKTLIPGNLFGRYDKFGESAHMLPAVIRRLHEAKVAGSDSVVIWGSGQARREFLLASDFAEMVVQCIEKFDLLPQAMNIGVGHDNTIDEYYAAAAAVVGYTGRFTHDTSQPDGMARKLMDVSVQASLGIMPQHDLAYGISETYDYFLMHEKEITR